MRFAPNAWIRWVVVGGALLLSLLGACAQPEARHASLPLPREAGPDGGPDDRPDGGAAEIDHPPDAALAELGESTVCMMAIDVRASSRPGVAPFRRANGSCAGHFCDTVTIPPPGADACFVAEGNIARAERESRRRAPGATARSAPWDKRSAPRFMDRVDGHLHLAEREMSLLRSHGFVVLDRAAYDSYAVAFHDVFQQQLPVYVGVDAIFNAIFQGSQTLLGEVEKKRLGPKLLTLIDRMRATLGASRARYDTETAEDLDLYLTVAHRLLHPSSKAVPRATQTAALVEAIVEHASAGSGLETVEVMGRARVIDFSQYTPRGHYAAPSDGMDFGAKDEVVTLREYFLAMTWLSRFELNLVSRSCRSSQPGADPDPSETPREARDALALADLASRAGVLGDLRAFEDVYGVFAGKREDVSVFDLLSISAKAKIGPRDRDAPDKLKAAIGDGFKRTARVHYMPQGASELPTIMTLFGPRLVPDTAPLTHLVHDAVAGRASLGAADVAYLLGHDRAKKYLARDLEAHPSLAAALDKGRAELAAGVRGKQDVYSAWLAAALALADPLDRVTPSFMKTEAYADMRMSSALAVYAQIRHTFVLLAGQGYDAYGCEIPDGWVEPAIGAYDAMASWARAARAAVPSQASYFRRVEDILGMLRSIAATELTGAPLSEPQRRWLGMVSEYTPTGGYADSGEPPKYTGWYFDLFPDREIGAERPVDLVADYFTLTNANEVRYLGIEKAALGVFVVDTGGEPRVMVGPVAKTYEATSSIAARLDDESARKVPDKKADWLGFLAPERPAPSIAARVFRCADHARVVVQAGRPLGDVSVALLDHHGDPLGPAATHRVGTTATVFAFDVPDAVLAAKYGIEGMHLHVHESGGERWDRVLGVSVYRGAGAAE